MLDFVVVVVVVMMRKRRRRTRDKKILSLFSFSFSLSLYLERNAVSLDDTRLDGGAHVGILNLEELLPVFEFFV